MMPRDADYVTNKAREGWTLFPIMPHVPASPPPPPHRRERPGGRQGAAVAGGAQPLLPPPRGMAGKLRHVPAGTAPGPGSLALRLGGARPG